MPPDPGGVVDLRGVVAVKRDWLDYERLDRTSTADQLAAIVRERILSGALAPGTPIRELALAESLGVSRNTVREGVRLLLSEGLLTLRPHKGIAVATVSADDISEIYEARRLLELTAVRTSDAEAKGNGIGSLHAAIEQMTAAIDLGDLNAMRDADTSFHRAIVEFLGNERLVALEVTLLGELRLGLTNLDRGDVEYQVNWAKEHTLIASAIETGRRSEAAKLLTAHLRAGEARLLASNVDSAHGDAR
jgi:DNA-binding GntR family transcriptional regulator